MGSGGAGPSVTSPRAQPCLVLSLQVPAQTSTPGATSSQLTMPSVIWFFFWPMFVLFIFACVFYALRDEAEEIPGMVPSGRHFRVRVQQNQPAHAPGWFVSKSHCLVLFLLFLVILQFPRGSEESNVCTPRVHRGRSFGSPGRKKIKVSPHKDSMCGALTQVEKELVNIVFRVRNVKFTAATGEKRQRPNIEVSADPQNTITVYEVWNTGDSDGVDLHIKEEE